MIQSSLLGRFPELAHGLSVADGRHPGGGNMSLNSGPREEVLRHRLRFCEQLGVRAKDLIMADQVHGDTVLPVTPADRGKGAETLLSPLGEADALCTAEPGLPLTVLVADCPAVFCYDPERRAIGLAHSGWRSTAQGIVPRLVTTLSEQLGACPERLRVWISPSIGFCCFEVGPEVLEAFRRSRPELRWREDGFRRTGQDRYRLDLKGLLLAQLLAQGVPKEQIEVSPECTCCEPKYFSYRRTGKGTGHMMGLLAMRDRE